MTATTSSPLPETLDERAVRLRRIRTLSAWLKWFLTLLAVLTGLIGALFAAVMIVPNLADISRDDTIDIGEVSRTILDLGLGQRIGLTVLLAVIIIAVVMVLWKLRQVFAHFGRHDFFSSRTLSFIVQTGWWLLALAFLDIIADPIGSFILTMDLPEMQRQISLNLEGGQILFLIFGPVTLLFGWVMREAALAYEENQQFV